MTLDPSDNTVQSFWMPLLFTLFTCDEMPDDSGLRDITPTAGFGPGELLTVLGPTSRAADTGTARPRSPPRVPEGRCSSVARIRPYDCIVSGQAGN